MYANTVRVGVVGAELAVGHRETLGQSARNIHEEELAESLPATFAARREQHALAVGMPVDHPVVHRVMRESLMSPPCAGTT